MAEQLLLAETGECGSSNLVRLLVVVDIQTPEIILTQIFSEQVVKVSIN